MSGHEKALWKLKRTLSNLAVRMSLVNLMPGSNRPLLPLVSVLILGFTIFVLSGGLFVLVGAGASGLLDRPTPGFAFVYPDINNQTPQEGVLAMLLYSLGTFGLYSSLLGTRYAYRQDRAYALLLTGIFLTLVFLSVTNVVLNDKHGSRF